MTLRPLMTGPEVAAHLRMDGAAFRRAWRDKVERDGFPMPVLGGRGGNENLLWSPAAIEAWQDRRSGMTGKPGRPPRTLDPSTNGYQKMMEDLQNPANTA